MDIDTLLTISHYAGMREDLVQAGGGNSSVKTDDSRMLIKSSGCQLGDLSEQSGWSVVDCTLLADFLKKHARDGFAEPGAVKKVMARALLQGGRPSIETFLHAVTDTVTLHAHPTLLNVLLSRKGGREILEQLFPDSVFVGYATPGIELAMAFYNELRQHGTADPFPCVFLQNHGLIVSGRTADEVIERTEAVEAAVAVFLRANDSACRRTYPLYQFLKAQGAIPASGLVCLSTDAFISEAGWRFRDSGWPVAISPDGLSYCGRAIFVMPENSPETALAEFRAKYGDPVVILQHGHIYITGPSLHRIRDIEANLRQSAQIALLSSPENVTALTEAQQDAILCGSAAAYKTGTGKS